jgi:uncharacterized protein with HEPN domain
MSDILCAMQSIEQFVEGMKFEQFVKDDKTVSAVIRKFEIIGEAAKHVPEEVRRTYSTVSWSEMAGMRDRLIHEYFGVDHELVWRAIKRRIPELKPILEQIIKELK